MSGPDAGAAAEADSAAAQPAPEGAATRGAALPVRGVGAAPEESLK